MTVDRRSSLACIALALAVALAACDGPPTTTAGGAASDASAGANPDGGDGSDAADAGTRPDGATDDGGAGGGAHEITCGDLTCTAPDVCCVSTGGPGGASSTCTAADGCAGAVAACDGPEDCPDTGACCGSFRGSACGAADSCLRVVCHVDADCTGEGETCCHSSLGVSICSTFCF